MSKLRSQLNNLTSRPSAARGEVTNNHRDDTLVQPRPDARLADESLLPQNNYRSAEIAGAKLQHDQASHIRDENKRELADIKSTLQNLTRELTQRAAQSPAPDSVPTAGNAREIDQVALANSLNQSLQENLRDQMATEIDKMRSELGALQHQANEANNRAVLDDIQRISEGIHDLQSRQVVSPDQFGEMAGEMRGLHQDLRSLSERPQPKIDSSEITQSLQQSYDDIAKRLDGLGSSPQAGNFEALSEKLELIKNSLPTGDPQLLNRIEVQVQELSAGITALADVSSNGPENAIDALLPEYFEGLDRRMDEITRAVVASAPSTNNVSDEASFERIEARIASLAKSVENLSLENGSDNLPNDPNYSRLLNMPEQLQSTLAGLEQQIAQISASGNSDSVVGEEFGGQLAALTQKIDQLQLAAKSDYDAVASTEFGSNDFGEKIDSLTQTLERAINSGDGSVVQLEDRISELSDRIEQAVNADMGDQQTRALTETRIFDELQALAARVEQIDSPAPGVAPHGEQLSALESQIASIAAQLQNVDATPDLSSIESRLGGIEEQFAANREVAIEAATQAAQQAVSSSGGESQTTAISALAQDLKSLTASSSELKGHSLETFDAVRDSLSMILDRINGIEVRMASEETVQGLSNPVRPMRDEIHNAQMVDAARDYASSLAHQNSVDTYNEPREEIDPGEAPALADLPEHGIAPEFNPAQLPQVNAPSLDLQHAPLMENMPVDDGMLAGSDTPLEPGSGAPELAGDLASGDGPDMGTLMRQAKENKRKDTLEDEQQNPTDFIAAARRAALAAARDEDTNASSTEPVKKKKSKFKLPKFGKKPVMIGAAVLLMAAVAIPAVNYFGAPSTIEVSQSDAPGEDLAMLSSDADTNKDLASEDAANQSLPESLQSGETNASEDSSVNPTRQLPQDSGITDASSVEQDNPTRAPSATASRTLDATNITRSLETGTPTSGELTLAPLPPAETGPIILRQAAASGNAKAQFEIARRYTNGINGTPDYKQAAIWYERSANSGFAPAQYRLGNFYEKGHGIASDVDEAASWYKKAAKQGSALAMHNLAVINAMGVLKGGANMVEASTWFKMAAEHGVKDSQVNLGIVYAKAMGVDVDLAQAYKWFAIAAKAGDKDAAQKRDTVAKQMRPDQLELARGEVELWHPKELDPQANTVEIPSEWSTAGDVTASLTTAQMIQKTQAALTDLGFKPGPADGLMGAKTVRAIKEFQTRAGIKVNGKVTPDLLKALENTQNKT